MLGLEKAKLILRDLRLDQVLFRQGDAATAIYFVEKGRLRLERHSEDGHHLTLHSAGPGEFLAEASLFSDFYHCDAVAVSAAQVRVYPKRDVLAAMLADPASAEGLVAYMARQLQKLRHRAELRTIRSARRRVMLYLEHHTEEHRQVKVEGELQQIAAELGLTREAFYRTLATLEREGVIRRQEDIIEIVLRRNI